MADKEFLYKKAIREIKENIKKADSLVPRMATVAAVLKDNLPYYLWCGFYFAEEDEMVVGPYQGTTACPTISYNGVCGASAKKRQTIIVPDVHKFPGHIVCDERSNSEIVVPIVDKEKRLLGVLDVDSSKFNAFDKTDEMYLKKIIEILLEKI